MSFDEQPDDDEHALCRHEIDTLKAENERLESELADARDTYRLVFANHAKLLAVLEAARKVKPSARLCSLDAMSTVHADLAAAVEQCKGLGE